MTPQEAITSFNALKAGAASAEVRARSEMAITAIERCMVAKNPEGGISTDIITGDDIRTNVCPNCDNDLYRFQNHCEKCGQLIDWSDVE